MDGNSDYEEENSSQISGTFSHTTGKRQYADDAHRSKTSETAIHNRKKNLNKLASRQAPPQAETEISNREMRKIQKQIERLEKNTPCSLDKGRKKVIPLIFSLRQMASPPDIPEHALPKAHFHALGRASKYTTEQEDYLFSLINTKICGNFLGVHPHSWRGEFWKSICFLFILWQKSSYILLFENSFFFFGVNSFLPKPTNGNGKKRVC